MNKAETLKDSHQPEHSGIDESIRSTGKEETEPFPHYPILITGAGKGTGKMVAQKFAREGYAVYIGTRSQENFEEISQNIRAAGGTEPKPFIADFTTPGQIQEAYRRLGIEVGQPIHFFPFAAAGFEKFIRPMAKPLIILQKAYRDGALTREFALGITDDIRKIATREDLQGLAYRVNCDAPRELGNLLVENGNLHPGSVVAMLSSNISDYVDLNNPENFPGPQFYRAIGLSKAKGVKEMGVLAYQTGVHFVNFVAPEIKGTEMSDLFANFLPILQALEKENLYIPQVTLDQAANAIHWELTGNGSSLPLTRKVYIPESGIQTSEKPSHWKIPVIDYF